MLEVNLLEFSLEKVPTLLNGILHARNQKENLCESHLIVAIEAAKDILYKLNQVKNSLKSSCEDKKKLNISAEKLVTFDSVYFCYFDLSTEEGQSEFYMKQRNNEESLLRHLTTWLFDNDSDKQSIKEINNFFGAEVVVKVLENLISRNHDT